MREQKNRPILLHILEDLQDIEHFTRVADKEEFRINSMLRKAVCMSLLNIGEVSRQLPEALTSKYPEIPWNSIVGLRNRVAHGYHALDIEIIWEIITNDLFELKKAILDQLESVSPDD